MTEPDMPAAPLRMWVCEHGHSFRGVNDVKSCRWTDGSPSMKGGFCGVSVTEVAPKENDRD